jgi:hypothetical protein
MMEVIALRLGALEPLIECMDYEGLQIVVMELRGGLYRVSQALMNATITKG